MEKIILRAGKYEIYVGDGVSALRYGEPWRDLTGDGLFRALCDDHARLRAELEEARRTSDYWKAEHLAGNKELEEAVGLLSEANLHPIKRRPYWITKVDEFVSRHGGGEGR